MKWRKETDVDSCEVNLYCFVIDHTFLRRDYCLLSDNHFFLSIKKRAILILKEYLKYLV